METQIRHRFANIGHWLARCNHSTDVIELNAVEFPKLSPLCKEYVWIHECVHLVYNVYDESKCNEISDRIFLSRATSEDDRTKRKQFLQQSNTMANTVSQPEEKKKRVTTNPLAVIVAIMIIMILINIKN